MSRIMSLALAATTAIGMTAGSFTPSQAAPMPALSSSQVAGAVSGVQDVRYRGGGYYGGGYGRGYRRGPGVGGALAAGAALGIIGGALAANAAPRYGYYDRGGYYGRPAYGYGYAPRPVYGYPAYGYPAYGYSDYGY